MLFKGKSERARFFEKNLVLGFRAKSVQNGPKMRFFKFYENQHVEFF